MIARIWTIAAWVLGALMVLVFASLSLTPLGCWPSVSRAPLYNLLIRAEMSKVTGRRGRALSQPGRIVWWAVNRPFMVIGVALLPVGLPSLFWFWLDLQSHWGMNLTEKIQVVQLLAATFVGTVAIDVFLWFQLLRILCPSIHAVWVTFELDTGKFGESYTKCQGFGDGKGDWVFFRTANTGLAHFGPLHIVIDLPPNFDGSTVRREGPERRLLARYRNNEFIERHPMAPRVEYEYIEGAHQLHLAPVYLAQGDSVVIPIHVTRTGRDAMPQKRFRVTGASDGCFGTTEVGLKC